jgi:DNA invertase Pin-like site-specific DNA recombinase
VTRPQLARALKALRPGDTLVVWKLDRLSRSLSHLVETIVELGRRGINFRSLSDPIDTKSAGRRFVLHITAALAEFERSLIVERTRAGLVAARNAASSWAVCPPHAGSENSCASRKTLFSKNKRINGRAHATDFLGCASCESPLWILKPEALDRGSGPKQ